MTDEYFGTCHVRNNAFGSALSPTPDALPVDYAEPFAARVRPSDCCAVITHGHHTKQPSAPRRCRSKRRLWNPNQPAKAAQCCQAHRARESEARQWMAARGQQ